MSICSERLKALFDNSGLSYQDLEKLTGVSKSSLQRYASGITAKIPFDVIKKISTAFNVPQEYLTGWDGQKNPPGEPQLTGVDKELWEMLKRIPEDQKRRFLQLGRVFEDTLNKE